MALNKFYERRTGMLNTPSFDVLEGPLDDISFSDEKENHYTAYTSLNQLFICKRISKINDSTLYIGKRAFVVKDNLDCFQVTEKGVVLNLTQLLGFKDRLSSCQALTLNFKNSDEKKSFSVNIVYLNRYILAKDPRKEENNGHLSVIIDTLVLDFPYKKEKNKSNLTINIDNKKLFLLLK
jgi:hypothetical protein